MSNANFEGYKSLIAKALINLFLNGPITWLANTKEITYRPTLVRNTCNQQTVSSHGTLVFFVHETTLCSEVNNMVEMILLTLW